MKRIIDFKKLPKTGRIFISLHMFEGEVWSQTYRYNIDGILESYCEAQDRFIITSTVLDGDTNVKRQYFVAGD